MSLPLPAQGMLARPQWGMTPLAEGVSSWGCGASAVSLLGVPVFGVATGLPPQCGWGRAGVALWCPAEGGDGCRGVTWVFAALLPTSFPFLPSPAQLSGGLHRPLLRHPGKAGGAGNGERACKGGEGLAAGQRCSHQARGPRHRVGVLSQRCCLKGILPQPLWSGWGADPPCPELWGSPSHCPVLHGMTGSLLPSRPKCFCSVSSAMPHGCRLSCGAPHTASLLR